MSTIAAAHGFTVSHTGTRAPARRSSVRLTRRGRIVLLSLFVTAGFALLNALGSHSAATDEAGTPVETRTVVVAKGDTLWAIASEAAEPGEVREMIRHIQELNALPSVSLQQGQEIAVPVG